MVGAVVDAQLCDGMGWNCAMLCSNRDWLHVPIVSLLRT